MKSMPWIKFNPKHFSEGVTKLSLEERGAYITLLALIYQRAGALPDEPRWLAGQCLISVRAWAKIRSSLIAKGKLYVTPEGDLMNERAFSELEKFAKPQDNPDETSAKGEDKSVETEQEVIENNIVGSAPGLKLVAQNDALDLELDTDSKMEAKASSSSASPSDIRTAFDEWNDLAGRIGLAKARDLTDDRRKKIRARLVAGGLDRFRAVLQAVEASKFCRGDSGDDRSFRADLDFILKPAKYQKLFEGGFGSEHKPAAPSVPKPEFSGPPELRAMLAEEAQSPEFVATYVDPATYDASARTLIARNRYAADQIAKKCPETLRRARVTVTFKAQDRNAA